MHPSESKLMKLLKKSGGSTASKLAKTLDMKKDIVGRVAYSLSKKGLVEVSKTTTSKLELTDEGRLVKKNGIPEKLFLKTLPKKTDDVENRLALNWAIKRGWVEIRNGKVTGLTENPPITDEEIALKNLSKLQPDSKDASLLKKRRWVKVKEDFDYKIKITDAGKSADITEGITQVTPEILKGGSWRGKNFQEFSPTTAVPKTHLGRYNPLTETLLMVRKVFLEMGFREAQGPYIDTAFWDFDALFVPQDHPARDMQDTFYLDGEGELPKGIADKVRKVHEEFWGGWSESEAKKLLLRTHTTSVSARLLSKITPPAKIFQIDRNFRNETVDFKHGAEFYQVEGIVVDEDVNFNNLVGYLKTFFTKLGVPKIRIRPGYFPYTEFSTEVDIWFKPKNTWMELGGAGIFRPEVVKPLLGKDIPVLAWGLGLERVAMLRYGIKDFRDLYRSDIGKLRSREVVL